MKEKVFILMGWLQKRIFFVMTFFSSKAKKSYYGRMQNKAFFAANHPLDFKDCIWFHTASLGEFEQVRFLIEKIKESSSHSKIVVTFFSASGFEPQKKFQYADAILYLPFENKKDINAFLDFFQPKKIFWVRYEFWPLIISKIASRNIPIILLNGVFRSSYSPLYKPVLKYCLHFFEKIYVVDEESKKALKILQFDSEVLSDTRFDRMQSVKETNFQDDKIAHFIGQNPCMIMGSTWPKDEEILSEIITKFPSLKVIIAPHEINFSRLEFLKKLFPQAIFHSKYCEESSNGSILIIDSIGMLSKLYRNGTINYVGGGFNKVVHSLLEPMAYGKPIIIGPNIEKSAEAQRFVKEKWVTQINNSIEFEHVLKEYLNIDNESKNKARETYFKAQTGSVSKIINEHILK